MLLRTTKTVYQKIGHAATYGGEVRTRAGLECLFLVSVLDKLGHTVNTEQSMELENRGE
jgi:hypothetical protein